jgi:undecaprenyldiphospho-muramoylpentapeptide beta-N-acetylglucosaminyltransferase
VLKSGDQQGKAWAVIAGGGTGGHLYPGVAVAQALCQLGHDPATLRFVGARRGLEARTRALEGFPVTLLPGRGLVRSLSGRALLANLQAGLGTVWAVAAALVHFARWRPSVVVSMGGYASLPCVLAAVAWRAPVVVVNVDAVPGAANRLAAKVAAACAVASGPSLLPRAVVTGVPVRAEMSEVDRSADGRRSARERLGLPLDAKVVAVSGGSLGSLRVNRAALELAGLWAQRPDIAIRHVVGGRDWEEVRAAAPPTGGLVYQQVRYEDNMPLLYAAADVAVQRAGASTVAELALAGVASLLVPLPGAPGDHQGANAQVLAAAGGAVVVPDEELDGARLASELEALLADEGRLASMGRAARDLARPEAAREVASLVASHARARKGHTDGS